jgi:hypothetical protein
VRRDWLTADFTIEADESNNFLSEDDIRARYANDWQNWPVERGAPFEDININGHYEPDIDIPGIPGADQTLWLVANDLDGGLTQNLYGSDPLGIEAQMTLWGYQRPQGDPFGDITFRRLRIIYKGTANTKNDATIEDMYLCQWSDPDIELYADKAGCDSLLGLAYAYASKSNHLISTGYTLLQGPVIPEINAMAQFDFTNRIHYKNLPVTSAVILNGYDTAPDTDPPLGAYIGTLQWYNLLQGLRPVGLPWINPNDNQVIRYPFPGDPVEGTGWIDPNWNQDRRIGINSGPFTMALGDTQEIITALIGDNFAQRETGKGPERSVNFLKNKATSIKDFLLDKVAVCLVVDTLAVHDRVRVGQSVKMSAFTLLCDDSDNISSLEWSLTEKPPGSETSMQFRLGDNNTFIPDRDGIYRIQVSANTTNGHSASNDIEIYASDNQPPEIVLNLSSYNVTFGDSILADASQTSDPEHDMLSFRFNSNGIIGEYDPSKVKVWIKPWTTGYIPVEVTVSDGYFTYNKSDTFFVKPKLENVAIRYTYQDTTWHGRYAQDVQYYFCGETLLVCIQQFGDGRVFAYHIISDTILPIAELPIKNVLTILRLQDNLLYLQMQGSESRWPGTIAVYEIADNWQLSPVLENYKPGQNEISSAFFIDDELYVSLYSSGQYILDIMSNPAVPVALAYTANHYRNVKKINQEYLVGILDNEHYVINRNDLTIAGKLNLPDQDTHRLQDVNEELMIFTIRNNYFEYSSLVIYNIADVFNPEEISKIELGDITGADWWWSQYEINWAMYLDENFLALYPYGGIVFYDISNPAKPGQVGAFFAGITGSSSGDVRITENNNNYYVHGGYASWKLSPFTGINSVDLKFTYRDNMYQVGQDYQLFQNYPNPFNSTTHINFYLPEPVQVTLEIYNILGQKIETVLNQSMPKGPHEINFTLDSNASGLYFYRIEAGEFQDVKKMILLR